MSEAGFYFNVRTGAVEEVEKRAQAKDLMGPYPSRGAAEQALETARQRTRSWDAAEDDDADA